jgi:hypothetical protein
MSEHSVPLKDKLVATGMDRLSQLCAAAPPIGRLIVGNNPVRWHATRTSARDVEGWREIKGDPYAGPRPVQYTNAVVLRMDYEDLNEHATRFGGTPAIAFAAGDAVLAAELPLQPEDVDSDGRLWVSMRLGRGMLRTLSGAHVPAEREFHGLDPAKVILERSYIPVEDLQAAYPTAIHL